MTPPLQCVPIIQRIFAFERRSSILRLVELATVTAAWQDTAQHFSGWIIASMVQHSEIMLPLREQHAKQTLQEAMMAQLSQAAASSTTLPRKQPTTRWMASVADPRVELKICAKLNIAWVFEQLFSINQASSPCVARLLLQKHNSSNTHQQQQSDTEFVSSILETAVASSSVDVVSYLFSTRRWPQLFLSSATINDGGDALIHISARSGNLRMIEFLITATGACVQDCDANGRTPLGIALEGGRLEVARHLIELLGNQTDSSEEAATRRTTTGAGVPAANTASSSSIPFAHGRDSLMHRVCFAACRARSPSLTNTRVVDEQVVLQMAQLLVEKGYSVDMPNREQQRPLHIACSADHVPLAKFLVENGADVNANDKVGSCPLFIACRNLSLPMIRALLACPEIIVSPPLGAEKTALHDMCRNVFLAHAGVEAEFRVAVRLLVERGVDVNAVTLGGSYTALMFCVEARDLTAAKILVGEFGADIDIVDASGMTVIQKAKRLGLSKFEEAIRSAAATYSPRRK